MRFHCKICDNSFKKFVLFEGHFDCNDKCRENHSNFLQCYICSQEFRHSAGLKYHLQQHRIKYVAERSPRISPVRVIPKITLRKEWNFKIVPQVHDTVDEETESQKKQIDDEPRKNEIEKSVNGVSSVTNDVNHEANAHQNNNKKSSLPLQRHQCSICKIELRQGGQRMARHMLGHTEGKFKCKFCNIKFSKMSLNYHLDKFHGIKFINNRKPIPLIRCKICKALHQSCHSATHQLIHKHGKHKCELCNGIRFTTQALAWHRKREHPEIDFGSSKQDCSICKLTLSSADRFNSHMKVHEIGKVKCEICDIRFTGMSLAHHQKTFHPELVVFREQPCKVCQTLCRSKVALDYHADMHTNGKFRCETCQISFTMEGLHAHNTQYHPRSTPASRTQCTICPRKFTNSFYLEQHMKVHINGTVECDICQIKFTIPSLALHRRIFHPDTTVPGSVPHSVKTIRKRLGRRLRIERMRLQKISAVLPFQCKHCKLHFSSVTKLERHVKVHAGGGVECRLCKVPFSKSSLIYHEKRFHPEMVRKDRILKALQRHLSDELNSLNESDAKEIPIILEDQYQQRLTENKLKGQCIICELPCGMPYKLDKHINVHIDGKYKCEICSVWFTKNSLESHQRRFHQQFYEERVLNGIRLTKESDDGKENNSMEGKLKKEKYFAPHSCDICEIRCSSMDQLAEHKRVHVIGTVQCTLCNITFTEPSLRYHLKRFHPEIHTVIHPVTVDYKCTICTFNASDAKRLEIHMTVHTEADMKCDLCNIPFTKPALINHMRRIHPDLHTTELVKKALERHSITPTEVATSAHKSDQVNQNKYRCLICKIVNSHRKSFNDHLKVHVDGDVMCHICNIWFTKSSLTYHYKRFHPEINIEIETRDKSEYECELCTLKFRDKAHFEEHKKVHQGNRQCDICKIPFTKLSLLYHYRRFHPNVPKKDYILKAIENYASKKSLHNCNKCGKSFTRICYLKLHMKTHRNGTEQIEIPLDFSAPLSNETENLVTSCPTDLKTETPINEHLPPVCQIPYDDPTEDIVYEEWVNPLDVYLSNWNPEDSREIISNQPLVLVENLDIRKVDLKSLSNFAQSKRNSIDVLQEKNGDLSETDLQNIMDAENERIPQPDTTQKDCEEIFEILSDDDDDDDIETIRYQLNNNACLKGKQFKVEPNSTQISDNITYISSDEEDDIIDSYHCYFCNGRFRTLSDLGQHEKHCSCKFEPAF